MEDLQRRRASRPRKGLRRAAVLLVSCLAVAALPAGAPSSARTAVPEPGSAGIGDSYFPLDGNGGINVSRYRIHDRYAFAKRRLSGWTLLNVRATQDLSRFHLDFLLPVQRVTVDGRRADFRRIGHELRIFPAVPLLTGQRFRVRVDYAGNPSRAAYDLERNWLASASEVVTMNEPHMAPWWFPANDHPRDRARMDIYINVPRGAQVVANGHRISRTVNGGRATTHWQARETMAPYLAFFAAGSFTVRQGRRDDGLPWYVAVSDALPTAVRARSMRLMLRTPGVLSWLETQLGDYPFSTTGGLTTALSPGFALENQTRPTYPVMGAGALSIVVHELAHQWFGDSVAVENWRDIWLNEGAATFMEVQYAATHGGPSASDWLDNRYRLHGADDDLWNLSIGDPGPRRLFDEAVYQRGAMTFQALRQRIGEPAFWQLLHSWLEENRYGNGSTPEFHALAEEVSGQDLDGFFQAWLFERSKPAATAENGLRPAEATLSRAGAPTGR